MLYIYIYISDLLNLYWGEGRLPFIEEDKGLSFKEKLIQKGQGESSFSRKLTQRSKLLEEAKTKVQASSRSLSKGCKLL